MFSDVDCVFARPLALCAHPLCIGSRCDRTYGMYVIFPDNVRTVRVRYFAVRWPHYMTKINYM